MIYSDEDLKRAIECARQVALANLNDLDGYLSPAEFYQKVLAYAREQAGTPVQSVAAK